MGTNAYGKQNMIVTYGITSEIVPSHKTMKDCANEIEKYGKINNQELVQQLLPYGVVGMDGNLTIPVLMYSSFSPCNLSRKPLITVLSVEAYSIR